MNIEQRLKEVLGPTYGGPSLSYFDGAWVVYEWFDAPSRTNILGAGKTIKGAVENYIDFIKQREKLTRSKRRKK